MATAHTAFVEPLSDGEIQRICDSLLIFELLGVGEYFGEFRVRDTTYPHAAAAITSACLLSMNIDAFRNVLTRHPGVAIELLDTTSSRL